MVILRTLTAKSILNCEKQYAQLTVQNLIDANKLSSLRRIYYTQEKINFTDEVLELIQVRIKIPKPGIDLEAMKRNGLIVVGKQMMNETEEDRIKAIVEIRSKKAFNKRVNESKSNSLTNRLNYKSYNQSINHRKR